MCTYLYAGRSSVKKQVCDCGSASVLPFLANVWLLLHCRPGRGSRFRPHAKRTYMLRSRLSNSSITRQKKRTVRSVFLYPSYVVCSLSSCRSIVA